MMCAMFQWVIVQWAGQKEQVHRMAWIYYRAQHQVSCQWAHVINCKIEHCFCLLSYFEHNKVPICQHVFHLHLGSPDVWLVFTAKASQDLIYVNRLLRTGAASVVMASWDCVWSGVHRFSAVDSGTEAGDVFGRHPARRRLDWVRWCWSSACSGPASQPQVKESRQVRSAVVTTGRCHLGTAVLYWTWQICFLICRTVWLKFARSVCSDDSMVNLMCWKRFSLLLPSILSHVTC